MRMLITALPNTTALRIWRGSWPIAQAFSWAPWVVFLGFFFAFGPFFLEFVMFSNVMRERTGPVEGFQFFLLRASLSHPVLLMYFSFFSCLFSSSPHSHFFFATKSGGLLWYGRAADDSRTLLRHANCNPRTTSFLRHEKQDLCDEKSFKCGWRKKCLCVYYFRSVRMHW